MTPHLMSGVGPSRAPTPPRRRMHADILIQIAYAIVLATTFAFIAKLLRQPVLLGYIAAGVLLGETVGVHAISTEAIEPIAELGLILLLFMIGLEIDLKKLAQTGKAVATVGILQVPIATVLGIGVFMLLGFTGEQGGLAPLYLGFACALASTMIVVKLLYDRFELDTTAGRVMLGILVFQDIWAILFLALQPNLRDPAVSVLLVSFLKGAAVVGFSLLASRYVLPVLFKSIAKIPELMVLGALAWCFAVVLIAAKLGLSTAMGALIAGVSLSTFPYNLDVIAKVVSLRDFFITLFFVSLGTKIQEPTIGVVTIALIGSAFVILSRFLTITPILGAFGKGSRVSFVSALDLGQVSEFSLVIVTLGVNLGQIDGRVLDVVLWMLVITSVVSTYAIVSSHAIYKALRPVLRVFGFRDTDAVVKEGGPGESRPIVFLGFARQASSLLEEMIKQDPSVVDRITVVDFNPEVREGLEKRRVNLIYGDISHADTLHHAGVPEARVVLSTIPDSVLKGTSNVRILRQLRAMAPHAQVIVNAEVLEQARQLYIEGAAYVLIHRFVGAVHLAPVVFAAEAGNAAELADHGATELLGRREVLA
ncbi:MAG TPA: cation:proton antiporter [Gemmatimonadaceae bacterium]|nr:cation:proton antiporter [Gemmatimonadaceae bacterium]